MPKTLIAIQVKSKSKCKLEVKTVVDGIETRKSYKGKDQKISIDHN